MDQHGSYLPGRYRPVIGDSHGDGCRMFSFEGKRMSALTVVGGLLALGLLAYLVAALLFPEDFS